jgi:hypothetical protein
LRNIEPAYFSDRFPGQEQPLARLIDLSVITAVSSDSQLNQRSARLTGFKP